MRCDKCGEEVPVSNDATMVQAYAFNEPLAVLVYKARHFLPVIDADGTITCEGSPSRAQYIDGQSRDTRGYLYLSEYEQPIRDAYARLLAERS